MHRTALYMTLAACVAGCANINQQAASGNPFVSPGSTVIDGKPGAFKQNNTGDCFFLAALLALAQDADGRNLLQSAIRPSSSGDGWEIVFPMFPEHHIRVGSEEFAKYRLTSSDGQGLSAPVRGDPDIALLEIAADKLWKRRIKAQGLWDDVPMNALFMFSGSEQWLLLNRSRIAENHAADIDKYRLVAGKTVKEVHATTRNEAETALARFIADDKDGLVMVLIDYDNYHAAAIVSVDFVNNRYLTLDTYRNRLNEHTLSELLAGIANGQYVIDYLET